MSGKNYKYLFLRYSCVIMLSLRGRKFKGGIDNVYNEGKGRGQPNYFIAHGILFSEGIQLRT